jgi:hypothetical protein
MSYLLGVGLKRGQLISGCALYNRSSVGGCTKVIAINLSLNVCQARWEVIVHDAVDRVCNG